MPCVYCSCFSVASSVASSVTASVAGRGRRAISSRRQGLKDLVGDVDARAHIHRFLNDQVVVLLLGDLLDYLVGAVENGCQFLIAALVQVFAELALLALKIGVQ